MVTRIYYWRGTVKTVGPNAPNSQITRVRNQGGELLPKAYNIKVVKEKLR